MPIIDVSLIEGRDAETKRRLIRELTDAAERVLEVPRASIRVLLREVPAEHWGIGGEPKGSVSLGETPKPPARPPAARGPARRG
jgi:4-oxalocrotonate tautomerase